MENSNYYIEPEEFEGALATFAQTRCPELLNEICDKYFYPLARKIIAADGCGYAQPDDLAQESVRTCQLRIDRFDRSRGTAFNFFTKVIKNRIRDVRRSEGRRGCREVSLTSWEERAIHC